MILECFEYNQHFVAMMNIINRAKRENLCGKFHKHHIIPRCFYKKIDLPVDNSDSNLVKLTFEEHQKVHQLAYLCARDIVKTSLARAFQLLCHAKNNLDITISVETRQKLSEAGKGRKLTEDHKNKLRKPKKTTINYSHSKSEEHRHNISKALKGRTFSDETRQKMSETRKNCIATEETKTKMKAIRQSYANEYKLYKSSGGKLLWNDFLHQKYGGEND